MVCLYNNNPCITNTHIIDRNKKMQPIIKWSGSKRSQTEQILSHFPKEILRQRADCP